MCGKLGMEIARPLGVGGINRYINIGRSNYGINFGNNLKADTFENNSIDRFTTEPAIKRMIAANPKIKNIVKNFNPQLDLNMAELQALFRLPEQFVTKPTFIKATMLY